MSETAIAPPGVQLVLISARRLSPTLVLLSGLLVGVAVLAVFGKWIARQDPSQQNFALGITKPSSAHWFGTDALGRDVFSRVLAGARTAVLGPAIIAIGSTLIGNAIGVFSGYKGGKVDALIMRWVDVMWSLPGLLVIIVVSGTVGGGYWLAVGLLIVLTAPGDARIIRGATLEQVPRPYVEAARTLGVSDMKIIWREIMPNVAPITVAQAFLLFSGALVGMAGLSFLGLGVQPGTADWGLMVAEGRDLIFANPVAVLAPGAMIVITATAMNLLGDVAYERLSGGSAR